MARRTPIVGDPARGLRDALHAAVDRAIGRARRVAVLGGGGLDSGVVLALAATIGRRRGVDVFPVSLDIGGAGDDRPYLEATARSFGVEPRFVAMRSAGAHVRSAFVADAAPYVWPSGPFERALADAAVREGADVILAGYEGDFVFDADPAADLLVAASGSRRARVAFALRAYPAWPASRRERIARLVLQPTFKRFVPAPLVRLRRRSSVMARFPWAGPHLRRRFAAMVQSTPAPTATAVERARRFATAARLAEMATARLQFETAFGVRFAEPMIDPVVLDFMAKLPPEVVLLGGRERGLLREAARGLLPEAHRLRTDKWSAEPGMLASVTAGGGFEALEHLRMAPAAAELGLVEGPRFARAFDRLAAAPLAPGADWTAVWATLAVEEFLQRAARGEVP